MASFTLRITQGVQIADWLDPASGTTASRLNPEAGFLHRATQGTVGRGIVVKATPDGEVEGAPDVDLDTHLFTHWFAEYPNGSAAGALISIAPGISSIVSFVPDIPGNYLLVFYREQGGCLSIPIEVVVP